MDHLHYFATDYAAARAKFLEAAKAAGARMASHANPGRGPDGGGLSTDVALLGDPGADLVLLANSGVHGVEGFCGSGALVGWLRSGQAARLPKGVRVVLIHAINPHGFAWLSRVTEENVDLNRNFLDHAGQHPVNAGYEELADWIVPRHWDAPTLAARAKVFAAYRERHGAKGLQAAISGGQYTHPTGVFHGGREETWSNRTFRAIVGEHLAGARAVAFIDYHTGLGPYGTAELITGGGPDQVARARAWYRHNVTSLEGGDTSSAPLTGVIFACLNEMLPAAEVTGIAAEYGTYDVPTVLDAVCADAWLRAHGDHGSDLGRELKARMRRAFYPDEDDWKELVWVRARQIMEMAVAGLARG